MTIFRRACHWATALRVESGGSFASYKIPAASSAALSRGFQEEWLVSRHLGAGAARMPEKAANACSGQGINQDVSKM